MNQSRILGIILVLQGLILLGQWTTPLATVSAQISDPGAQRNAQLDELKAMNLKMDKLLDLLAGGKLQVRVVNADEDKGRP